MPDIKKIYQLHDEASDTWFDIYKCDCADGRAVEVAVPRADRTVKAVMRTLLSKGAIATMDEAAIEMAIKSVAPCVVRAARAGWREGDTVFVSPQHVSDARSDEAPILPPAQNRLTANIRNLGTLEGWQTHVEPPARYSSSCLVILGCAFAAPLVRWSGRASFSIMLHGPSRCGKTTAALLGASAIGYSHKNKLFNCNGTDAGTLAAAHALSDHMIPMDEAGTAQGSKKEVYARIRNASYALCGGRDKTRHPSFDCITADATFNTIVIFTAERSPDASAERDGEARDEGECARLIGLPVNLENSGTIFDRPPPLQGPDLENWVRQQFHLVNEGAAANCGVAFSLFTDKLVAEPELAARLTKDAIAYFITKAGKPDLSPVASDIIASFGLVFAGLLLAIRAGILTFSEEEALEGIRVAAAAAVDSLPDPQADLKAGLTLLRENLDGGAILRKDNCVGRRQAMLRQADGYVEVDGTRRKYVVRADQFKNWFSSPLRLRMILEWLANEGLLIGKEVGQGRSNAWAGTHATWPDGTRLRSIILLLPNGLDDLSI